MTKCTICDQDFTDHEDQYEFYLIPPHCSFDWGKIEHIAHDTCLKTFSITALGRMRITKIVHGHGHSH